MANLSSVQGAFPVIPGGRVAMSTVTRTDLGSGLSVSSTSVAAASDFFASPATFVADGTSSYIVKLFVPLVYSMVNSAYSSRISLTSGTTEVMRLYQQENTAAFNGCPADVECIITPAAGAISYNVRPWVSSGTTNFYCGAGGAGNYSPAYLSVSRIVNQNDGLKPTWTPPIVTQLPTNPQVGDSVLYAADATNGVYWHLRYDGLGTYPWKFIGGPPLTAQVDTDENIVAGTTTYTALATAGPSITLALAGDYVISQGCRGYPFAANQTLLMSYDIGVTSASDNDSVFLDCAAGFGENGSRTRLKTGLSANTAIVSKYKHTSSSAGANFMYRWMTITPVRVKAA